MRNTKCFTSDKLQQAKLEKKQKLEHRQGTVISINEVCQHILKYPEVITNMNFFMIKTTLLEKRTGKSLQNPDNPTNNNFTQYDANVINNIKCWLED